MSVKPDTPITRKEMYLDVMTGGSSTLPEPETIEEKFLAKIAGMTVDLPAPVPLKHKFLAKIAGMQVDVPTYTTGLPRIYAYLAKAAGQDVDVPQPITREEMYWYDYVSGQPTPSEREYTGAVPVTFTADGTPLLDYLISGKTVQSGIPTPDNPIMPQGTGKRTGNLYNINAHDVNNGYVNNAQLKQDGTTGTWGSAEISEYIPISGDTAYTFNGIGSYNSPCYGLYDENKQLIGAYKYNGRSTIDFTSPNNARYFRFTHIKIATQAMTVEGTYISSTMPEFEPYGYKIPISSANTTTPVYLGEVETTRKIKKLVLTGEEETWDTIPGNAPYRIQLSDIVQTSDKNIVLFTSSHYRAVSNNAFWDRYTTCVSWSFSGDVNAKCLVFRDRNQATLADFKSYLAQQYAAGTPVTIWYVLATEETGIVNEPLMKIGDYADSISMEQAGVQIPTASGSNTLDVLTEVKPSEVYIKYKGEPVSQLSMLSSPGTDEPEEAPEELSEEAEEMPEEEEEEVPEETEITPETEE